MQSRRPIKDGQDGEELGAPPHQVAAGRPPADGQRPKGGVSSD